MITSFCTGDSKCAHCKGDIAEAPSVLMGECQANVLKQLLL
jgi:hypothetical protein